MKSQGNIYLPVTPLSTLTGKDKLTNIAIVQYLRIKNAPSNNSVVNIPKWDVHNYTSQC